MSVLSEVFSQSRSKIYFTKILKINIFMKLQNKNVKEQIEDSQANSNRFDILKN